MMASLCNPSHYLNQLNAIAEDATKCVNSMKFFCHDLRYTLDRALHNLLYGLICFSPLYKRIP